VCGGLPGCTSDGMGKRHRRVKERYSLLVIDSYTYVGDPYEEVPEKRPEYSPHRINGVDIVQSKGCLILINCPPLIPVAWQEQRLAHSMTILRPL
jgi:hypothetical protein